MSTQKPPIDEIETDSHSGVLLSLQDKIEGYPGCVVTIHQDRIEYDSRIRRGRGSKTFPMNSEELVRALFVFHLVHELEYNTESISIEKGIRAVAGRGAKEKYADIAITRKENGLESIYALIELKKESSYLDERLEAWEKQLFALSLFIDPKPEILVYGTSDINSSNPDGLRIEVVDMALFNNYEKWRESGYNITSDLLPGNYGLPIKVPYVKGSSKDLRQEIQDKELDNLSRELHNILWGGGTSTDTDVFNLITRLILAKITDELRTPEKQEYGFQRLNGENIITTLERIDGLYREGLSHRLGFDPEYAEGKSVREKGKSTDAQISFAVDSLEKYDFFELANSPLGADLLGSFFERIIRQGFKQTKGQFFTHVNIVDFIVEVLDLAGWSEQKALQGQTPPVVIDPATGSGAFLIKAMEYITKGLHRLDRNKNINLSFNTQEILNGVLRGSRRHAWASEHCYGLEINPDLGLAAQVNMLLHGDGSSSIFSGPERGDGLATFSQYPSSCPTLSDASSHAFYPKKVLGKFDAVISNPPFSVKYSVDDINRYKRTLEIASRTKKSEDLFIDRWFQLLKPGGRLGVVVPNSLLDSISKNHGRDHVLRHFWIRAIVSLPADAFYPYTSTKTSLLFAQKKTDVELRDKYNCTSEEFLRDHEPILFARATYLGYKRTSKNEVLSGPNDLDNIKLRIKKEEIWN